MSSTFTPYHSYHYAHQAVTNLGMSVHKLGTERIKRVLERLGNPQNQVPCIHVVGTNGKGSVCALLESIYRQAGLKTGLFTSPHLIDVKERIQINRNPVSEAQYVELANQVDMASKQVSSSKADELSFFEFLNAMAFLGFAQADVDIAIIEAGLGGRLDSTNVIESPSAIAITPIRLDHTMRLGHTLPAIAREKMAVMRPNVPVITSNQSLEVLETLQNHANSLAAPLIIASDRDWLAGQLISGGSQPRRQFTHRFQRTLIDCGLLGTYQNTNIAIALEIVNTLQPQFPVNRRALESGLAKAYWAGRYHWLPQPRVLLDGSHNRDGIEALLESVAYDFGKEIITWGLTLKKNRPLSTFDPLLVYPQSKGIVLIEPTENKDSYHKPTDYIEHLKQVRPEFNQAWDLNKTFTPKAYMEEARINRNLQGVTGSLYVVGEFLKTVT